MNDKIKIKGARQHNLKNISIELPRDKLIVITGLSGSGKSTLAFDTLYAEGQRRYVESLSSYARQFLGLMSKPDVDSIEGLSPAISIEQKTTSKNPRSTVGTVTEIYDYLRLLYARIGVPHCPIHNIKIEAQSPEKISQKIAEDFTGQITILSPIIRQQKGTYEQLFLDFNKEGYARVRVNGDIFRTDETIKLERYKKHDIKVIIDEDLIIPDKELSIIDGAIKIYGKIDMSWRGQQLQTVGKKFGFDIYTPIKKFNEKQIQTLFYGSTEAIKGKWDTGANMNFENGWEGLIPQSERLYKSTDSDYRRKFLEKFMRVNKCSVCDGKRLKQKILAVKINNKSIIDVTDLSIQEAIVFFNNLELTKQEEKISRQILKEIRERLGFLERVGLGYLTLSRNAGTLSGGEGQRIRLATQIGSNLTGVLYILDEPSIGLHQRDNHKLIETLQKLRDLGNTLIVVEHDEDTIMNADYVVDIGPGAGIHGGEIVAKGTPQEIIKNKNSLTGQYLSGVQFIEVPKIRREKGEPIKITGCTENNLKNIDVEIPTRVLTCVTGVSGSGKSTLINEILYKGMMKKIHQSNIKAGEHKGIYTEAYIDKVIVIDQSPIGKTPRSNPATYIGVFDEIRKVFASTKEAKLKGYKLGRFSFNVPGGRCEKCSGDGTIKIEMNFLPDVYIECEECKGKRYNSETLEIKYKDKSIAEVLDMSVEEALDFFKFIPSIKNKLETLNQVGLGYIKLGQSSTTLSGGESQRIKLTKELSKRGTGQTLYLLDEPTTGLHFHDTRKLISVLNNLVDKGNTIVVIEHNLDVIKCADYIIDLGPEGGDGGGYIVAIGTPEDIVKDKISYTGKYLKPLLK